MNELYLYQLFKNILDQSKVIEGRFVVAEGYGNDLNTNSFNNIITDALGSITTTKKYPAAILLPPVDTIESYSSGWSTYDLEIYFLTLTQNRIINQRRNTNEHAINYYWKDMHECAENFRRMFNKVVKAKLLAGVIRERQDVKDVYRRVSLSGNDKLSGVRLNFSIELFISCSLTDYETGAESNIIIPPDNIHPLHKML